MNLENQLSKLLKSYTKSLYNYIAKEELHRTTISRTNPKTIIFLDPKEIIVVSVCTAICYDTNQIQFFLLSSPAREIIVRLRVHNAYIAGNYIILDLQNYEKEWILIAN